MVTLILIDFRITGQLNNNQGNTGNNSMLLNNLKVQLLKNYYNIGELERLTTLAKIRQLKFHDVPAIYLNDYRLVGYLLDGYDGWWCFKRLPKKFRGYREIVLKACGRNGQALKHTPQFRNDREVAMIAVKSNPYALRYVSKELRFDISFLLECVQDSNYWMIPSEFKKDKEFNLELFKRVHVRDWHLCRRFRGDLSITRLIAIYHRCYEFQSLNVELLSEKETVLQVLDRYRITTYAPAVLSFIDPILRNDRDIVIKACSRNDVEYLHIENMELKNDPDVLEAKNNSFFKGVEPTYVEFDW